MEIGFVPLACDHEITQDTFRFIRTLVCLRTLILLGTAHNSDIPSALSLT